MPTDCNSLPITPKRWSDNSHVDLIKATYTPNDMILHQKSAVCSLKYSYLMYFLYRQPTKLS